MKITHLGSIAELPQHLQNKFNEYGTYNPHIKAGLSEAEALKYSKDSDIIILEPSALKPVSKNYIDQLRKTKHIAIVTMGTDWIDIATCKKKGISISRPIGANSQAVAEHALGMMIDLSKRISKFDRDVRNIGAYDFRKYTGSELTGKKLGILGLGQVGSRLVKLVAGFEMEILVFDRSEPSAKDFQEVLKESDYLAICLPLTNETTDLIGSYEIEQMKDGVIIINTAREEIINKSAIINAITSKKVAGYGIETGIMSPIASDDEYLKNGNILVNPHNAFNTKETQERTDQMVVDNIISFIKGKPKNIL